jgi:hypothetical protein
MNGQVEKHKILFGMFKGERLFRRPRPGLKCDINVCFLRKRLQVSELLSLGST